MNFRTGLNGPLKYLVSTWAIFGKVFNFYDTGNVDESGLVYDPVNFAVKKSLNSIAKKNYQPLIFKSVF